MRMIKLSVRGDFSSFKVKVSLKFLTFHLWGGVLGTVLTLMIQYVAYFAEFFKLLINKNCIYFITIAELQSSLEN